MSPADCTETRGCEEFSVPLEAFNQMERQTISQWHFHITMQCQSTAYLKPTLSQVCKYRLLQDAIPPQKGFVQLDANRNTWCLSWKSDLRGTKAKVFAWTSTFQLAQLFGTQKRQGKREATKAVALASFYPLFNVVLYLQCVWFSAFHTISGPRGRGIWQKHESPNYRRAVEKNSWKTKTKPEHGAGTSRLTLWCFVGVWTP